MSKPRWMEDHGTAPEWGVWAAEALERALSEVRDGEDAIPAVSLAMALLRAEAGELDADQVEELLDSMTSPPDDACTCPPDLRERGGYTSTCLVHGSGRRTDR
jgi:hypothetical protein